MVSLRELRKNRSLTQEQAAKILDITKEYLSMMERGERNPSDRIKEKLANLYDCGIEQIFFACKEARMLRERK